MLLREELLRRRLAIVPDEKLGEELLATTFTTTSNGRIIITPKSDIKARLNRSPDRADALSMSCLPDGFGSYTTTNRWSRPSPPLDQPRA